MLTRGNQSNYQINHKGSKYWLNKRYQNRKRNASLFFFQYLQMRLFVGCCLSRKSPTRQAEIPNSVHVPLSFVLATFTLQTVCFLQFKTCEPTNLPIFCNILCRCPLAAVVLNYLKLICPNFIVQVICYSIFGKFLRRKESEYKPVDEVEFLLVYFIHLLFQSWKLKGSHVQCMSFCNILLCYSFLLFNVERKTVFVGTFPLLYSS